MHLYLLELIDSMSTSVGNERKRLGHKVLSE